MSDAIKELITDIKRFKPFTDVSCPKRYQGIHVTRFINALEDLLNMVGMESIKLNICRRFQVFFLEKHTNTVNKDKGYMHTIIFGQPGTGKTEVGKILARLWISSGYIANKYEEKEKEEEEDYGDNDPTIIIRNLHLSLKLKDINRITNRLRRKFDVKDYPQGKKEFQQIKVYLKELEKELTVIPSHSSSKVEEEDWYHFVVICRGDLVSKFQGETLEKLRNIFLEAKKKKGVIMIDEAYSLLNDSANDNIGKEIINELNHLMTRYPEVPTIWNGYKNMFKVIFDYQPGLISRFQFTFNIDNYSPSECFEIFLLHLRKNISFSLNVEAIEAYFRKNNKYLTFFTESNFPSLGRDLYRFVFFLKEELANHEWSCVLKEKEVSYNSIYSHIENALEIYKSMEEKKNLNSNEGNSKYHTMYS